MNLHEYQAKQLFAEYGLPVPIGVVLSNVAEVKEALAKLNTTNVVVKAQVHAGGRGSAGGVKLVSSEAELAEFATKMLGTKLVTYQTDANGQPVNKLLVEPASSIESELYLSAVLDRSLQKVVIIASKEGGVDIEKVASRNKDAILKIVVDPLVQVMPYQCRELSFKLGLNSNQSKQFQHICQRLALMFKEKDLSLVEVNPLIITKEGDLLCLDAKVNIDDNALYRQKDLAALRDPEQEDPRELEAHKWELNYIALDGDIGCMVNGAGLAMATMDLIKLHGGNPANFLDVGGGATKERVTAAFKIILSSENVKGVLINIFGGIVRCDLIAEGIIAAIAEVGISVPVVVRLEGNRADIAANLLEQSKLNIIAAESLEAAAVAINDAVKG